MLELEGRWDWEPVREPDDGEPVPLFEVKGEVPVLRVYGAVPVLLVDGAVPVPAEYEDVEFAETMGEPLGREEELDVDATDDEDDEDGGLDERQSQAAETSSLVNGPPQGRTVSGMILKRRQNSCGSARQVVSVSDL